MCGVKRGEHTTRQRALPLRVQAAIADTELVQFLRSSSAGTAVRRPQIVEDQQLARTEPNALLNGFKVEGVAREMRPLRCERCELQAAEEVRVGR